MTDQTDEVHFLSRLTQYELPIEGFLGARMTRNYSHRIRENFSHVRNIASVARLSRLQ